MKPKGYKNVIFDFGGVILNLDYQLTIDAFKKLGLTQFDENYSQLAQTSLFDEFERGDIKPAEFRSEIKLAFNGAVTDEQIDKAWNAMLLDLPKERLEILEELGSSKRMVLLSNTNRIHIDAFEAEMLVSHGIRNLSPFFDKVYYSCEMRMRKPEARIFEYVLAEQNFNPQETLFIDDSIQHIEGARKVGLHAYHLRANQGETILDLF